MHPVVSLAGQGCLFFVAVPVWALRQCVVCIDTLAVDGCIYATPAPSIVDVFSALAAAGMSLRAEVDIFVDSSRDPLADGQEATLRPGSLLRFVPKGATSRVDQLSDDLAHRLAAGDIDAHGNAATGFSEDIAALFGGDAQHLQVVTAAPCPLDVAFQGQLCHAVTACRFQPTPLGDPPSLMVLLDCRRLLSGWATSHAPDGLFDVGLHLAAFATTAPVGWQPVCEGCPDPFQPIPAVAGQVFVFRLRPDASLGLPSEEIAVSSERGASACSGSCSDFAAFGAAIVTPVPPPASAPEGHSASPPGRLGARRISASPGPLLCPMRLYMLIFAFAHLVCQLAAAHPLWFLLLLWPTLADYQGCGPMLTLAVHLPPSRQATAALFSSQPRYQLPLADHAPLQLVRALWNLCEGRNDTTCSYACPSALWHRDWFAPRHTWARLHRARGNRRSFDHLA